MSLSNGADSLVISLVMLSIFLLMETPYDCGVNTKCKAYEDKSAQQNTVNPAYNDIGQCDTLSITSYIL
jgi:hypothetical protein